MKKILIAFLFFGSLSYGQTKGISYQALIIDPVVQELPGFNNTQVPLANRNICLRFSFIDELNSLEYEEIFTTTTDDVGMVNLIIGTEDRTGGYASSFEDITWSSLPKNLKVDLSVNDGCSNFIEISNAPFTAVPFALFALNTENTPLVLDNEAEIILLKSLLATTQLGAGLNADGTYSPNASSNFITGATSLNNADTILDGQVKNNKDVITDNTTSIGTNTTGIATNTTAITDNTTNITTNTSGIATNTNAITDNTTSIGTNTTGIADNTIAINERVKIVDIVDDLTTGGTMLPLSAEQGKVLKNLVDTTVNILVEDDLTSTSTTNALSANQGRELKGITDTNSTDIATNVTDIATNTSGIATNVTDIATNTSGIATNVTDIATNTSGIATNVTDIATNTSGIATNVTDIATNTSGIATNVTDIATNTSGIATNVTDILARVETADVVDDLITGGTAVPLSAEQGKVLKGLVDTKITGNTAITAGTNTKITYDAKGLVTAGSAATTADIDASTDRNYVTDAEATVIDNTSGTNTGDQTAAEVVSTATGAIVATNVDSAIAELEAKKLALTGGEMNGNIIMNGTETVDGRDISVDGAKLDGIAAGAQVNVSGDSGNAAVYDNSGTPTLKSGITKTEIQTLINVEDGADVTDATNVLAAGAVMTTGDQTIAGAKTFSSTIVGDINGNAATATTLETARNIAGNAFDGSGNITIAAADLSDVTDAGSGSIISTAERTKLTNIETSADVTDATNVLAAGAVMTTGDQTIAGAKTFSSTIVGDINGNILDSNGNELVKGTATASAVNEITVTNAATGNGPTISVSGDDTNVDLNIEAKGTGVVNTTGDLTVGGAVTFNEIVDNNSSISTDNTSDIVTINASSGKFRFQNGSTSKTINNSFVTTSSIIICTISGDNPVPRNILSSVAGSGSFVVTLDGNPLSDNFDVNFLIIN